MSDQHETSGAGAENRRDFLGEAAFWTTVGTLGFAAVGIARMPMPGVLPGKSSALKIGPPRELEVEWPPRFAQAIGFLALALATILFLVGLTSLAWLVTGAVAALQTVLAATGYCLGCRLYFLSWKAPVVFRRLAR